MIHFKEKLLYITNDDGILHYSKLSLKSDDIYVQNYDGMNKDAIKFIIDDIKSTQRELEKLLKSCYDYEIDINTNRLF